jgi:hypothetical protein
MKKPSIRPRHLVVLSIAIAIALLGVYQLRKRGELGLTGNNAKPDEPLTKAPERGSRRVTNQKFIAFLPHDFTLPDDSDDVGLRILQDYGAIFVSSSKLKQPASCIFAESKSISNHQLWKPCSRRAKKLIQ